MFHPSAKFQTRVKNKIPKKWRLCHATDFQSLMFPCFTIGCILGMFPYSINGSTFQTSKWRYTLSSIIIVIFCISLTEIFYEMNFTKRITFSSVPHILRSTCYNIFGGFIAIITYILSGPRMRLLQTVMDVSSRLPPESYRKMSKFIHITDISFFLFTISQMCHFYYDNILDSLFYLHGMYITLTVSHMDMLYMNCVCVLKACFEKINDNLTSLQKVAMIDEPHFLEQSHQRNPFLLMELKALKKQHLIISDTVQKLNIIFSLQLLATVVMTFTEITFNLYFLTENIYKSYSSNNFILTINKSVLDKHSLIFIAYFSIKMAIVVWSCEAAKNQAMGITTTVHDVLVRTNDKEIKNEVTIQCHLYFCKNVFNVGVIFFTNLFLFEFVRFI